MNYQKAKQYIQAAQTGAAIQPGLETISLLLEWLHEPQEDCSFIHLAGTNGKGSTGTFLTNVLAKSGRKIGRYFSPALFSKNETIQWKQNEKTHLISQEEYETYYITIARAVKKMEQQGQPIPTEFEIETALAFLAFSKWNCDLVVLETGMGGALDATNVVKNVICNVITPIAKDHKKFLGDSLEEIARHKAGIITTKAPVVSSQENDEVWEIIANRCKILGAPLYQLEKQDITGISCGEGKTEFYFQGEKYEIQMCGHYQIENACLALLTLQVIKPFFSIPKEEEKQAMFASTWPGRFDFIRHDPVWIADGAHNPGGLSSLLDSLNQMYSKKRWIGIMGVFGDKDYKKMCRQLAARGRFETIVAIRPPGPRGLEAEKLAEELKQNRLESFVCSSIPEAVEMAEKVQKKEKESIVICFGSLSFMSELYQIVMK